MNISINVEEVVKEIENIKIERDKLKQILKELTQNTNALEEYWQTRTSEEMFSSYGEFKNKLENLITNFDNDISFLENTVKRRYENYEAVTNKVIDDKVAV